MPEPDLHDLAVVVPLYNRAGLIGPCLQTMRDLLGRGAELIVVDDGSTDGGDDEVTGFAGTAPGAVRLLRQENAGPGAARNRGVDATDRGWILFIDSDDLLLPWTGEVLAQALAEAGDCTALFLSAPRFSAGDDPAGWTRDETRILRSADFCAMRAAAGRVLIGGGYFAIRRETFRAIDGFDPSISTSEDMDLFFRLPGPVARIDAPAMIAARLDNSDSMTNDMLGIAEGMSVQLAGLREGRYDAHRRAVRAAQADGLQFWLRALFNHGYGARAYGILLREGGLGVLLAERRWQAAAKLMATPALSLVRPAYGRFSWHPRPGA